MIYNAYTSLCFLNWIQICKHSITRCVDFLPHDGTSRLVFIILCFVLRITEALGNAAAITSVYAISTFSFPDNPATVLVRRYNYLPNEHIGGIDGTYKIDLLIGNQNISACQPFWCQNRKSPGEICQQHCCWWTGSLGRQIISSHGVDNGELTGPCLLPLERISTTRVISVTRN